MSRGWRDEGTDPDQRHGPCWTWTRSGGKTITRALTPEQADGYRPWLDNARCLRDLVAALRPLAIEQTETDDTWPAT